ncbi:hypothetical protein EJB05_03097 [Eragrostis curvula]|uniref:Uncharacterized protein n=1 Tax=Eragrostis curvula TaxID=38414 RepID=A0A5J9WUS1_9POAL|nr:hypothetical protein EJB05_03097 [Eragrostis curvula]
MRASTVLCFIVVAALVVAIAALSPRGPRQGATRLHEEVEAFKEEKLPWWWDTDYMRSKRRRPKHN